MEGDVHSNVHPGVHIGDGPEMEGSVSAALEMVKAAMMEELGIGRKDTLPLEDRGFRVTGTLTKLPVAQAGNRDNPWNNAVFHDVDEAELKIDTIAEGQLYRQRRALLEAGPTSRGGYNRGGYNRGGSSRGGSSRGGSSRGGSSRGGSSRGGHETSKADVPQGFSRGGHGAVQRPSRGNQGGARGGHAFSPARKQPGIKNLSAHGSIGFPSIPKAPKSMRSHGTDFSDGPRKLGRNHMVDAAIARLRAPPPQAAGVSQQKPVKSTYGSNLVGADEFYARTKIDARPAATSSPSPQATLNANNASQLTRPNKLMFDVKAANAITTDPTKEVRPVSTLADASSSLKSSASKTISTTDPAKKVKPISTLADTSTSLKLIGSKPTSTTSPIVYGQAGLAGSCWATNPVVSPSAANTARSKDTISPVSTTSSIIIPPITSEKLQEEDSSLVILRSIDGIKILSGSFQALGSIRLVRDTGSIFANLEILVDKITILQEALYMSDTFTEKSGTIKFQAYSQKGESPIWAMVFPLPYQASLFAGEAKDRRRNEPRPIQEQPLNGTRPEPASPNKELSNYEAPNLPAFQHADTSDVASPEAFLEDGELLIDFGVEETTSEYISPNFQVLMGLMTDDASIVDFLNRLNQPTGGAFLDRVFSSARHPSSEGFSPRMLAVAKDLVLELYTQSDVFHNLPEDTTKSLVDETSQKVLEKALSEWSTQIINPVQSAQLDGGLMARSKCHRYVYSPADLLDLRSHATIIEEKLIPEYEKNTLLKVRASSKSSSLSGDCFYARSRRDTLKEPAVAPVPPAMSSAILVPPVDSMTSATATTPITPKAAGDDTHHLQVDDVFGMIHSEPKQFQCLDPLDSGRSHKKNNSSSSAESHNTENNGKAASSVKRHILDDFESEVPHLSPKGLDQISDSTDSDLLTKLKRLSLDHSPTRPTSALATNPAKKKGEDDALTMPAPTHSDPLTELKELDPSRPPSLLALARATSAVSKEGEGNASNLPAPAGKSHYSFVDINNSDLKGHSGLAASKWAQDIQSSTVSGLRRTQSSRTSRSPNMSSASAHQPEVPRTRLMTEFPYTPQPVAHLIHQPRYNVPHQAFVPQLTTVLVTDPITGEMREVTGVQTASPASMPFSGGFPSYQRLPMPPVPTQFPFPSTFLAPRRLTKLHDPSPSQGGAPSFFTEPGVRSPLSPTRRENSRVRGERNPGSPSHNRQ